MKTSSRGELEEAHIRGGRYSGRGEAAVRLLNLQSVTPQSSFIKNGEALEEVWTLLLSLAVALVNWVMKILKQRYYFCQ